MAEMENSTFHEDGKEDIVSAPPAAKKKRNLPGMPDPNAEVVALSPKTLLATNRFVCEICNKGFQRDQNLQLHRRGHNMPWKLKQRTNKEEVKKRVYVCPETSCVHHHPSRALGDLTGIKKHFCRKHGEKKYSCERCSRKYAVLSDWKAHIKTCGSREYRCDCGTSFSRKDSFITHRAFCDALAQESAKSSEPPVVQTSTKSPLSIPSPPPLTPSTGVASSPVLSIQSSDHLPENRGNLHNQTTTTATTSDSSPNSGGGLPQSTRPSQSYSGQLISSSMSLYGSNNTSTLYPATSLDHYRHYLAREPPALSATALLQRASQMDAKSSDASFLRGLGLILSDLSDPKDNNQVSPNASSSGLNGLMMMGSSGIFYDNKPTTL